MQDEPTNPPNPLQPEQTEASEASRPLLPEKTSSNSVSQSSPSKSHKKIIIFIAIIVVVVVVGALIKFLDKPKNGQKDIPYVSVGTSSSANLTQLYPTETADTDTSNEVNAQLFEGLVRYKHVDTIEPLLATSWYNPNNTTWVFNIRKDVKFHSGRTMSAYDVKYSLDYAVKNQNAFNGNTNLSLASSIDQVDVVNPYQIKIVTSGPDPVLLNRLAWLYIMDSKARVGDPNDGTGPYVVKPGTQPSSNSIDLTAYNNYWGGHVYTREVKFQIVSNANQLASDTANGQFDIASTFTNSQLSKVKNAQPKVQPVSIQDLGITFLGLNTLKAGSPLQSLAARQAASYALDIPAILKAGGLSGSQASQLVPIAIEGHNPSINNTPYNPSKAKALLATVPNASAPLTLIYTNGDQGQVEAIVQELNAVGFNIKLSLIPSLDDLVNMGLAGQADMFYASYSSSTLDGLDILNSIVLGNQDYNSASLTNLANKAASTLSPSARIAILQNMAVQVANNIPDIPLYTESRVVAILKPYNIQIDIPSVEPGVYFWQTYQK